MCPPPPPPPPPDIPYNDDSHKILRLVFCQIRFVQKWTHCKNCCHLCPKSGLTLGQGGFLLRLFSTHLTIVFELVCRCKIPYKIQKLEQKHHNFDNITMTLFLKLDKVNNAGINFIHNHPPAHPRGFAPKICSHPGAFAS